VRWTGPEIDGNLTQRTFDQTIAEKNGIAYRQTNSAITLAEDIKAAFGS
jgi:hypothetical protein